MGERGRPRSFDRDEALTSAMYLFWEHGFDATSLAQLKAQIGGGISAPSFYAAFASKEALYKEAVERYMHLYGGIAVSLYDATLAPRDAILKTLRRAAKMYSESGHPRGCMVASGVGSASSAENEATTRMLQDYRGRARLGFRLCAERGIHSGELRQNADPDSLALAFDSFFLGLSAVARDGEPYEALEKSVNAAMGIWDASLA